MTMHTAASNSFSIASCQPPHDYQSDSNSAAGPAQPIHASSFQFHADGDVSQAVRTIILDGEPWFIARDVAEVLGYANPNLAIRVHCKGGAKCSILSGRGAQSTTVIPERDVYRLVMRSKLPAAERFEEWVVGTVLPAIRKTGSYVRGEEAFDVTTEAGLAAATMHVMAALQAKADSFKALYEAAKPKAEAFRAIEEASGALTVTAAAKSLGSMRNKLFAHLELRRWITKGRSRQATAAAIRSGYMTTRTHADTYGRLRATPLVTPKGLAYLAQIKARHVSLRSASAAA